MTSVVFAPLLSVRPSPGPGRVGLVPQAGPAATPRQPLTPQEVDRFKRSMLPHLDAAFSFARFLTRDATQAEDVVQDAYLRAYRSFTAWRGDGAKAWLFAIVRSSWQDSLRRQNRGWTTADEADDIADDADTPEQALLRSANSQAVRNAIEALADPFREAIVLRELEGLSYREIAEVTAAPMGTVMSRLGRARQLLIAALGPEALS